MTAVLPSPSHHPSSTSSLLPCTLLRDDSSQEVRRVVEEDRQGGAVVSRKDDRHQQQDLSLLALLVTVFRKSWVGCRPAKGEEMGVMEIGWPTNVRHVAHVTFDRFHGFLGLPVEFEPEVPRRVPSASASVFGVSAESMQCSFDNRGNSVPTILLLMQRRLYSQGGLQAEGIFRINAENSQEEYVRDHLNSGIVPDGIDVHCLAGLIKAWFRELPTGVLDSLTPEQVMQCHSEEDCVFLLKFLLPTEAALLNWAVNLMADVAQEEHRNKMNSRNVAMVFAPNMTQMADPLTALMYAVQVMNFLRTLIERELKDRQESLVPIISSLPSDPSNENGHPSAQLSSDPCLLDETVKDYSNEEPFLEYPCQFPVQVSVDDDAASSTTQDHMASDGSGISIADQPAKASVETIRLNELEIDANCQRPAGYAISRRTRMGRTSNSRKWPRMVSSLPAPQVPVQTVKPKCISIVSRINSKVEHVEAWR